jgi:hypothetical protein
LYLANTQGGLHDLPKKFESWIPIFSGEEGLYGNSHWTKFCEGFEFHQSRQEHLDVFMRLFAISLIRTTINWIITQPSGSFKTPKDLERAFKKRWCKEESIDLFYSQYLGICKGTNESIKDFNDRLNFLLSNIQPNFHPKGVILHHYLNSLEGTL